MTTTELYKNDGNFVVSHLLVLASKNTPIPVMLFEGGLYTRVEWDLADSCDYTYHEDEETYWVEFQGDPINAKLMDVEKEDEEEEEEVYKGYVRTNTGEVLVQIPDPQSRWGFYLADEEQSWDGGLGITASAFEVITESEVSEEDKERLGWILSQ